MNKKSNTSVFKIIEIKSVSGIPSVTRTLRHFLAIHDLSTFRPMVQSVVQELLINAIKANQKRMFFNKKGLDFFKDFKEGNEEFIRLLKKKNIVKEIPESSHYNIKISFLVENEKPKILIQNNSEMHPAEKERVKKMLAKGKHMHDLTEIIENQSDIGEGAGIGLIMSAILLNNAGFPEDSLNFKSENGITVFSIELPSIENLSSEEEISLQNHLHSIDFILPVYKKSLEKLKALPEPSSINTVKDIIKEDPALIANLLRISAPHLYKKRLMERAIRKTEKATIIENVTAREPSHDKKIRELYTESIVVANLCNALSSILNISRDTEYPYMSGMLHNIGKILIHSLNKRDLTNLVHLIGDKKKKNNAHDPGLPEIDNAWLGFVLLRFWNLPYPIYQTILYQDNPEEAPDHIIKTAAILYLAKSIYAIKNKTIKKNDVNFAFLEEAGIAEENEIITIFETFINSPNKSLFADEIH